MPTLTIPHKYWPRRYQLGFFKAIDTGIRRVLLIWPRRHGKDKSCFNALVKKATERVGNYYYIFPEYNQGRKALWDNIDSQGMKTIDHIPKALRKNVNNTEMKIELANGSIIQVVGAADIDRIVGTNPVGVVFSEYSLIDPMVWGYIYPILKENGGFAWFNMTPRGSNHAKRLLESAMHNPEWYVSHLNALQCAVYSAEELETIRQDYYELYGDYQLYDQEFMTSFDAPVQGAYFAVHMQRAKDDGRICNVPYDSLIPVNTYWDLGVDDSMTIWFVQLYGNEIRFIDYYENNGEGIPHYINVVNSKGYTYGKHYAPHDIQVRELTTGVSRLETSRKLGINFEMVPRPAKKQEGIDAIRTTLSRSWFDEVKCEKGIDCLMNYHKEFDEVRKVYKNQPYHDWSSHGVDGMQTFSLSNSRPQNSQPKAYKPDAMLKRKRANAQRVR